MKINCMQGQLNKALNTVSKAVSTRTTIPILKGILLSCSNGILTLTSSDLDLIIEKKIDVNVLEEGQIVLPAKLFGDIIRKLPNEEIEIEEIENNNVIIRCLASEFTIAGNPPDDFPGIGEINMEDQISFNIEILKDMIKRTYFSASIDESKGIIVGILIEMDESSLNMVALDGFRMAVSKEYVTNEKSRKIIIAARILNEINKIMVDNEEEKDINLILDEKKAVFLLKDTKIVLRLLEGEFIKYKDIIPKENKCDFVVSKNELLTSIERASLLAKEGKNNLIKFTVSDDKVIITSRSEEGNVKEEVFIEKNGENLEIGFNSKYVLDVLKVINDEEIKIELNTSVSPCIVKPIEGDSFLYLILPVRIASS